MDYSARQKKFQQTLVDERLDGFVVTHPANLRYLCGYTGSNGLLLFLNGRKTFFTDGRYTLQAREEVKGAAHRHIQRGADQRCRCDDGQASLRRHRVRG